MAYFSVLLWFFMNSLEFSQCFIRARFPFWTQTAISQSITVEWYQRDTRRISFLSVTEMFCCQILSSFSLDLFCLCYGKVFVVYIQSKLQIKSEQSKYQSKSFNNSPTFQDQCLKLAVQTCLLKPSYANCGCIISKIFRLFYVHGILSKIDLAFKYFFVWFLLGS